MWWKVDVGGESGHFQVGGWEQVFWVWQSSWVHRLRESKACWMFGMWLFGKVVVKLAVFSSKCGGSWIMERCMTLRLLRFVQRQLMVVVCLKKAGKMWEWRCKAGIGGWLGKIPFPEGETWKDFIVWYLGHFQVMQIRFISVEWVGIRSFGVYRMLNGGYRFVKL